MKRSTVNFAIGLLLIASISCFYEEDSEVVKLTTSNFKAQVLESEDLWLVEFYAPWCGHCKKLAPEWDKAAKGLKGFVKMGAVDMTVDGDAGRSYDVQGYPTIKFFGIDKSVAPEEFDGNRSSSGIIAYATKKIKEIANTRIGNKKKPQKEQEKQEEKKQQQQNDSGDDGDVVVLTEQNWAEILETSNEPWFVEFYAPWCGHCKNLAPTWKKLAASMKGKINIAKVDATQNNSLSSRYGVKGYPTLKFFPGGAKSDSSVETYQGGRDLEQLEAYCAQYQPARFQQLVNQQSFEDFCTNNAGLCIITFLPSLYDSTNEQRQSYLAQIESVANSFRGKPFTFLWSEGGTQFDLENTFNVGGAGYPAVVAITVRKTKYSNFRSSFNEQNLKEFVDHVGQGKGGFYSFNTKPTVKEVPVWTYTPSENSRERTDL